MRLLEYQAKKILEQHGIRIPKGQEISSIDELEQAVEIIDCRKWAIKAQIPVSGRFYSGAIKFSDNLIELKEQVEKLFGTCFSKYEKGLHRNKAGKLLIEEAIDIEKEIYLSIMLDPTLFKNVIITSPQGGIEIEELSSKVPEKIITTVIDDHIGIQEQQIAEMFNHFDLSDNLFSKWSETVRTLYQIYKLYDARLLEINPLALSNDEFIAIDVKMIIDDNALFWHPEFSEIKEETIVDPFEQKAEQENLSYVRLEGNIGCMVNGAGLAMATMDLIKLLGGKPANFLDIGGNANIRKIGAGLSILNEDPSVEIILVNIFGGIVRCDIVASAIVKVLEKGRILKPMVIRLAGTNAELGMQILKNSKTKLIITSDLKKAVETVLQIEKGK